MPRDPIEDPGIRLLGGLPEESVRLALEHEAFGAADASRQRFGLLDVIAADVVIVADGTLPRLGAATDYALWSLISMFSREPRAPNKHISPGGPGCGISTKLSAQMMLRLRPRAVRSGPLLDCFCW